MTNPRLAGRYAKSLLDLSVEQNSLEAVYADMKFLLSVNKSNPDFVAILKSPVITPDKKLKIIQSVTEQQVSKLTTLFVRLLIQKARESNLPEIVKAFIDQYNKLKNIHKVRLTTAVPVSNELQKDILKKVITDNNFQNIELESVVEEDLIGGFKLEMGGLLVDASILRDLNDVKKQFADNEYIHKIR
ncbi:MAG TPA: ATP synthase F1 subunit delta [Ferruginibacter sp.]|nr:ATP synthase F1 subunit delta [Ferruginibacter sp.]